MKKIYNFEKIWKLLETNLKNQKKILNSSLFGVLVGIFLSDSHYLGPGGIPEFKISARTFFRLQRLVRTKISFQLFFTAEPSPFESFSKGWDSLFFENLWHVASRIHETQFLLVKHNFSTFAQGWNDLRNVNFLSGRFFS